MGFKTIGFGRYKTVSACDSILSLRYRNGIFILFYSTCNLSGKIGDRYDLYLGDGADAGKMRIHMHEKGLRQIKECHFYSVTNRLHFQIQRQSLFVGMPRLSFSGMIIEDTIIKDNLVEIDVVKSIRKGQLNSISDLDRFIR